MSVALEKPTFNRDESIARWREHSISLDRKKRFTLTPNVTFLLKLSADEWAVFNHYYSLAPTDHPGEDLVAPRLKMGRHTLRSCIVALQKRGMIFCDFLKKNRQRIINISHPCHWQGLSGLEVDPDAVNPYEHEARVFDKLPERMNQARAWFSESGRNTRLPYLLFQTKMISSTARMLYGLICWLPIHDHPTTAQLAAAVGCSEDTAARHLAQLVECRMIDFTVREPGDFGDHVRYYYHTYDVSQWRCLKALQWYGGGKSSLAELDATGRLAIVKRRPVEEDEDFEFCDRPALRLIASQHGQTLSSQPASQHGQNASQHGQPAPQHGQPASGIIGKSSSIPGGAAPTGRATLPNKIEVRKNSSKEDSCNSRAGAHPYSIFDAVDVAPNRVSDCSVHFPRIINIANSASFVWESQSFKYDRALWTGAVKDVIVERGEDGGLEFCEFVIGVFNAKGRKLPYDPLTIRKLKSDFLGRAAATVITVVPTEVAAVAAKPALECEFLAHASHSSATASTIANDGTLPLPSAEMESEEPAPVFAAQEPQPEPIDLPVPTDRDPLADLPADEDRLRWLVARMLPKLGRLQKADLRDLWSKHGPRDAVRRFADQSSGNRHLVMDAAAGLMKVGILRSADVPRLPWEDPKPAVGKSRMPPAEPAPAQEHSAPSGTENHTTLMSDFQSRQARMLAGEKAAVDAPITRARLNHAITVLTRDYKFATRVSMARGFEKLSDVDLWERLAETFTEPRLREVLRDIP